MNTPVLSPLGTPRVRGNRRPSPPALPLVSVAIICHNYGRYLEECVLSLAAGSYVLHELFVIDDASTDDTAKVCERLGVRRIAVENRSIHANRALACETATGEVLCFLDADDRVAADYFAAGCELFRDPNVGIVYSDCQCFGSRSDAIVMPEFDADSLWRRNCIHAGSLVRKAALISSRCFETPCSTSSHADWTIWKRVVASGWLAKKQSAKYFYRQHGDSMLQKAKHETYYDRADLANEHLTLFVPLSGRKILWPRMVETLEWLDWPSDKLSLILFDTSQNEGFSNTVRKYVSSTKWHDIRHVKMPVGPPLVADRARSGNHDVVRDVRVAMARIYNWLRGNAGTHYVMVLEDDVFPKNPSVIASLLRGFNEDVSAVSAPYLSAHGNVYVAWELGNEGGLFITSRGDGYQRVGGAGFGCVILRRDILRERLSDAMFLPSGTRWADYDVNVFSRLAISGGNVLMDWSQECDHIQRIEK